LTIALLPYLVRPASADGTPWSLGGAFTIVSTRFAPDLGNTFGIGVQASVLRSLTPLLQAGAEAGIYGHSSPGIEWADDGPPPMLAGDFTSGRIALTGQMGPRWVFAPYAVTGVGFYIMENRASWRPDVREHSWGIELGAGVRGRQELLPWLEWRWHRGLSRMAILDGSSVDYQTVAIGVSWN
jgi:hypothetical protein